MVALALLGSAGPAPAAGVADGTLLIASPDLADPNFAHTVVLVLRSDTNGTIGVILNRPTTLVPAKIFPELAASVGAYTGKLFRGGPVAPSRLLFLVRGLAAATVQGPEVVEKVFLAGDPEALPDIVRLADGTKELRMYAGPRRVDAGPARPRDRSRWLADADRHCRDRVPREPDRALGRAYEAQRRDRRGSRHALTPERRFSR